MWRCAATQAIPNRTRAAPPVGRWQGQIDSMVVTNAPPRSSVCPEGSDWTTVVPIAMVPSWVQMALPAWIVRRYVSGVRIGSRGSSLVPFSSRRGWRFAISKRAVSTLQGDWEFLASGRPVSRSSLGLVLSWPSSPSWHSNGHRNRCGWRIVLTRQLYSVVSVVYVDQG